jgi:hypothetical protein
MGGRCLGESIEAPSHRVLVQSIGGRASLGLGLVYAGRDGAMTLGGPTRLDWLRSVLSGWAAIA